MRINAKDILKKRAQAPFWDAKYGLSEMLRYIGESTKKGINVFEGWNQQEVTQAMRTFQAALHYIQRLDQSL